MPENTNYLLPNSPDPELVEEEHRRMRYLRVLVDFTAQLIMQSQMSRLEAEHIVEAMRRQILRLFPGEDRTYDIIYRPRFERLVREFASRTRELKNSSTQESRIH